MLIRFLKSRSVLSALMVVFALGIGIICLMNANSRPKPTMTGSYGIEYFAIHRHLGNGDYKIDATPVLELAREIVKDDKSSKVSFDERSQSLIVTSTQENLQRIRTRMDNMYRAIGVELGPKMSGTTKLSSLSNARKQIR